MSSPILRAVRPLFRHPGRVLLLGLALLMLATQLSAQSSRAQERAALKARLRAAGFRVLIGMRPDSLSHGMIAPGRSALNENAAEAIARKLESKGLKLHGRVSLIPLVFGEVAEADLDGILDDPQVEYLEPDVAMPLAAHTDGPAFRMSEELPWGIPQVTAPAAWALGGSAAYGAGVKVAYLDSGADLGHPDLVFAGGYNPVTNSTASSAWADDIAPCNGHGTHIAGTIAGRHNDFGVVGVAPEVSLYPIKVFENLSGSCLAYTSSQISGLNWAVNQGIRVVSVSIGGTSGSSSYQSAISSAASKGTYLVAAAGNNGSSTMTYPGNYQDVISVASLDAGNNHSSWSNYGPNLYISAPGESILSTMPGGSYGYKSGTSMATPHVAGVVALLLARYPGISRSELLTRLQQGALDLGAAGRDDVYGWGLARAREAMDDIQAPPPPPPPPPPAPVPLALSVSPTSRSDSAEAGSALLHPDSATVSLSGDGASTAAWTATNGAAWLSLVTPAGIGSGTLRWTRNPLGLAAGSYVDTIAVSAAGAGGSPTYIIDNFRIYSVAATPLTEQVSPSSRYHSVKLGSNVPADSARIVLSGMGAAATTWTASNAKPWIALSVAAGTGTGDVRWSHNLTGLAAGTYIDTITVVAPNAIGSPSLVIDTLIVTAQKGKRVGRTTGTASGTDDGVALHLDSVYVDVAAETSWEATTGAAWVTLLAGSRTGPGYLHWQRSLGGMSYGISQDSIVVSSGNAREVELVVTETIVAGADQVAASVAASALFEPAALDELRRRMLDLLGNANGRYDVGDLLAYLDRTGYSLSAPLLARVMQLPPR
jgi:subtilisin family serine protease